VSVLFNIFDHVIHYCIAICFMFVLANKMIIIIIIKI